MKADSQAVGWPCKNELCCTPQVCSTVLRGFRQGMEHTKDRPVEIRGQRNRGKWYNHKANLKEALSTGTSSVNNALRNALTVELQVNTQLFRQCGHTDRRSAGAVKAIAVVARS